MEGMFKRSGKPPNEFFVRCKHRKRRRSSATSSLQCAADGGKGVGREADALNSTYINKKTRSYDLANGDAEGARTLDLQRDRLAF